MVSVTFVYDFSGYNTNLKYTDIAISGSKIAVGSSATNTFFHLETGNVFSSATYSPIPLTTTATPVGVGGMFFQGNRLYFADYDNHVQNTTISSYIYWTDDFVNFSSTKIKIEEGYTWDVNYNTAYPNQYHSKKPCKIDLNYSTTVSFNFNYFASQGACLSGACSYVLTLYFTSVTNNVLYSTSSSGVVAGENSKPEKYVVYSATNEMFGFQPFTYYNGTKFYAVNTTNTTYLYEETSVTTTIPLNGLYSLTDCTFDYNNNIVIFVGKSGYVVAYDKKDKTPYYRQTQSKKDLYRIKYWYDRYSVVAGNNEIFKLYSTNIGEKNLPSQIFVGNTFYKNIQSQIYIGYNSSKSLSSQFKAYQQSLKELASQVLMGNKGTTNLLSQFKAFDINDGGIKQLSSQIFTKGLNTKKLPSIVTMVTQPSNYYHFSFKNTNFSDLGIFVTDYEDGFSKNIDIEKDYTKNGYKINRFNYYGGNKIVLRGKIITDDIDQIQKFLNKISHETGKLYKRLGFYTVAQLESFNIQPSKTGRVFDFQMTFLAEKPYYYFENLTTVDQDLQLRTTPIAFYNTLPIINDDSAIIIKNKNVANYFSNNTTTVGLFSTSDWIVSTGYQIRINEHDTMPTYYELITTNLIGNTFFDTRNFSIGARFPVVVSINRFYFAYEGYITQNDYNDVFEIYYKNIETKKWQKYNQPFFCYVDEQNKLLVFDNLFLTTYEFKVRCKKTKNSIWFSNSNNALIIPKYYSKFYFTNKKDLNSSYEYVWDSKNNIFYINMLQHGYYGQMLRIYPKTTYIWCNKNIDVKLRYKFNDLYFAL